MVKLVVTGRDTFVPFLPARVLPSPTEFAKGAL